MCFHVKLTCFFSSYLSITISLLDVYLFPLTFTWTCPGSRHFERMFTLPHLSQNMCQISHVTCHMSPFILFFFFSLQSGKISSWRVLSTGPTPSSLFKKKSCIRGTLTLLTDMERSSNTEKIKKIIFFCGWRFFFSFKPNRKCRGSGSVKKVPGKCQGSANS